MKLTLQRTRVSKTCTFGELSIDRTFECYTLEDLIREVKTPKETAIPAGEYKVILSFSNRFKKELPELLDVPNFTGVRIHSGNTNEDTEGCILVGQSCYLDTITNSRAAMKTLMEKLKTANDISITVLNPKGA